MDDRSPTAKADAGRVVPFFETRRCALYHGDAEETLRQFTDDSIDCVVTSPPYYRSREYRTVHPREIGQEKTADDYVRRLAKAGREILRTMQRRGSFWLAIGDTWLGDEWLGVPWQVAFAMRDLGWKIRNEVIWHESKRLRRGAKDRLGWAHVQLFHFVKDRSPYYRKDGLGTGTARTDVWAIDVEGPAPPRYDFSVLPALLVERCIKATCPPDGVVLDPFVGSGTTAAVALRLGRRAIGIDTFRGYLRIARERVSEVL